MFYLKRRVGFSEISTDYKIKTTKLLDYFQDVTIRQSEELNIGVKPLRERGMCWVLSSWQIDVLRYPELDEEVQIGTAPYEFKGFMGSRNFILKSASGEVLARANSLWSFVDVEKMTLTRVPQDVMDAYVLEEKLEMDYLPRKIKLPPEMEKQTDIEVKYHNIDVNGHVNNAQYIAMAEDLICEGRRAKQIRAEYRASALYGDTIVPYTYYDEENKLYLVSLANTEGKPYVIVEIRI